MHILIAFFPIFLTEHSAFFGLKFSRSTDFMYVQFRCVIRWIERILVCEIFRRGLHWSNQLYFAFKTSNLLLQFLVVNNSKNICYIMSLLSKLNREF